MDDLALNPRRRTAALRFHRGLLRFTPLLLAAGLLVAAGCGDDAEDDGGKSPAVVDGIRVETDSDTVNAEHAVRVTSANWFDDGATFRGNLAADYDGDDEGDDDETVTVSLTLWAQREEAIEAGTFTLTGGSTRRADHAILSLNFGGEAYEVTEGTLTLRAIEGDPESGELAEKLRRLSLTFEGTYTVRGEQEPRSIEGEIVFGS